MDRRPNHAKQLRLLPRRFGQIHHPVPFFTAFSCPEKGLQTHWSLVLSLLCFTFAPQLLLRFFPSPLLLWSKTFDPVLTFALLLLVLFTGSLCCCFLLLLLLVFLLRCSRSRASSLRGFPLLLLLYFCLFLFPSSFLSSGSICFPG